MGTPIQDPLNIAPPAKLSERAIYVSPNKLSTFRLMHDPFLDQPGKWFDASAGTPHGGNEAKFLIRGTETYSEMYHDIRATERSGFVYLLAWFFNLGDADKEHNVPAMTMVPGNWASQPRTVFGAAAARGVEIRAMLWSQRHARSDDMGSAYQGKEINAMPGARCIVDDKTAAIFTVPIPHVDAEPTQLIQRVGSHHQKVLVVNGPSGLLAYCGGLDINRDRVDPDCGGERAAFQDVHLKIRGPSAYDLLFLFRQRWDDYLFGSDPDVGHDGIKPLQSNFLGEDLSLRNQLRGTKIARPAAVDDAPYRQVIQIARTFHSKLYSRIQPAGGGANDPLNPPGEKGIRKMIFKGINTAERFIYIEDQYLFDPSISAELQKALAKPNFRHLIILIPPDNAVDGELYKQAGLRRANVLNPLLQGRNGKKVHVFFHDRFVHSKIYIFDDQYAVVGSANCNRRGFSHDSEVDAGVFDRSSDQQAAMHFARRLRMRLWATHFNLHQQATDPNVPTNTDDEYSELADGVASAVHWFDIPQGARFKNYVVNNTDARQLAQTGLAEALHDAWKAKSESRLSRIENAYFWPAFVSFATWAFGNPDAFWDSSCDPSDG